MPDKIREPIDNDEVYPCDDCGKLRSQNLGGTVFTVCDECWNKHHLKEKPLDNQAYGRVREALARKQAIIIGQLGDNWQGDDMQWEALKQSAPILVIDSYKSADQLLSYNDGVDAIAIVGVDGERPNPNPNFDDKFKMGWDACNGANQNKGYKPVVYVAREKKL